MSNRKTIIDTMRTLNSATVQDLADATGWDEYRARNTVHEMRQAKLVSSRIDDITGKPIYTLTAAGKAWNPSRKTCDTPAGGGDISPAPAGLATSQQDRSTARAANRVRQDAPCGGMSRNKNYCGSSKFINHQEQKQ